ncbi:MAG: zinc ribbon domain-containing protein [Polyangiales bacterium]
MAFCPNCGTPNTEQAERCVACGFELIVPKQKAKFKGTIMMSGIQAPSGPQAAPASKGPAPAPDPAASDVPPRKPNYQKTMMGQPPIALPPKQEPAPASVPPVDLGTMPTMQGQSPLHASSPAQPQPQPQPSLPPLASTNTREFQPDLGMTNPLGGQTRVTPSSPSVPTPSQPSRPTPAPNQPTQGGFASYGGNASFGSGKSSTLGPNRVSMGGAYESTLPPAAPPNPAKVIAVGCGVVLALFLVVGGALWFAFGDRIKALFGGESEASSAEAAAWHASIGQSLTKVNELCAADCAQAGVFFHPLKQAALLGEARALTPARVAKLNDPASASAVMLDHTDDSAIATQLGLDPQQCARVTAGGAIVISCSVPDPTGKPSVLRIVQLSGVGTL